MSASENTKTEGGDVNRWRGVAPCGAAGHMPLIARRRHNIVPTAAFTTAPRENTVHSALRGKAGQGCSQNISKNQILLESYMVGNVLSPSTHDQTLPNDRDLSPP